MPKKIAAQWVNTEEIDRQLQGKADLQEGKLKDDQIPDNVVMDDELALIIQNIQNGIYPLVNDLETGGTNKALSAEQGKVLKLYYDQIKAILQVNDTTKDTLQEIVDFIKLNKATLDTLGINNIAGLTEALYNKANRVHTHIIEVNVGTARNDRNKIGTTVAGGYVPQKGDQLLVNFVNGTSISTPTLNIDGSGAKNIRMGYYNTGTNVLNLSNVANSNIKVMMRYDGTYYQLYGVGHNTQYSEIPENEISDPNANKSRAISGRRIAKMKEHFEQNVPTPTQPTHSANKDYVDVKVRDTVYKTTDGMYPKYILGINTTSNQEAERCFDILNLDGSPAGTDIIGKIIEIIPRSAIGDFSETGIEVDKKVEKIIREGKSIRLFSSNIHDSVPVYHQSGGQNIYGPIIIFDFYNGYLYFTPDDIHKALPKELFVASFNSEVEGYNVYHLYDSGTTKRISKDELNNINGPIYIMEGENDGRNTDIGLSKKYKILLSDNSIFKEGISDVFIVGYMFKYNGYWFYQGLDEDYANDITNEIVRSLSNIGGAFGKIGFITKLVEINFTGEQQGGTIVRGLQPNAFLLWKFDGETDAYIQIKQEGIEINVYATAPLNGKLSIMIFQGSLFI